MQTKQLSLLGALDERADYAEFGLEFQKLMQLAADKDVQLSGICLEDSGWCIKWCTGPVGWSGHFDTLQGAIRAEIKRFSEVTE